MCCLSEITCPTPEIIIISVRTAVGGNTLSAAIWFWRTDVSRLYTFQMCQLCEDAPASCRRPTERPNERVGKTSRNRNWSRARNFYFTVEACSVFNPYITSSLQCGSEGLIITGEPQTNMMSVILVGWKGG